MVYQRFYSLLNFILFSSIFVACSNNLAQTHEDEIPYDSISKVIRAIGIDDQAIRQKYVDSISHDNPRRHYFVNKIKQVDSVNMATVTLILQKYGWPPQSKIGHEAADDLFYIIQHSKTEVMELYFLQLKKLAAQGEASRVNAAMMEDRLRLRKGLKQIYGSQVSTALDANHTRLVWPIENPSQVDSLRKSVGFELTVFENAKRLNAVYDSTVDLPYLKD